MFLTSEAWNAALEEIEISKNDVIDKLVSGGCGAPDKYYELTGYLRGMKFALEVLQDYSDRESGRKRKKKENDDVSDADEA